jgi:hypothetical protein
MANNEPPLSIDYYEGTDSWKATLTDEHGRVVVAFKYHKTVKPSKNKKKASGVVGGAYQTPPEDGKSTSAIITPKTPAMLENEALEDWNRKNIIQQATKPYERN